MKNVMIGKCYNLHSRVQTADLYYTRRFLYKLIHSGGSRKNSGTVKGTPCSPVKLSVSGKTHSVLLLKL